MMKRVIRSAVSLMLVFLLLASSLVFEAGAAARTITINGKSVKFEYTLPIVGEGKFTPKTSSPVQLTLSAAGVSDGDALLDAVWEVTVKKLSGSYVMGFDYSEELEGSGGSCTIKFVVNGESQTIPLENGWHYNVNMNADWYIDMASEKGDGNKITSYLKNITVGAPVTYSTTVVCPDKGGTVTLGDGTVVEADESVTRNVQDATGLKLTAVPEDGYIFAGYSVNDAPLIAIGSAQFTYFPQQVSTITPVFLSEEDGGFLVGDSAAGYTVAENLVDAISTADDQNAKYIIAVSDMKIPAKEYKIPSGTTLVIPNDATRKIYTKQPPFVRQKAAHGAYVRLTLESGTDLQFEDGACLSIGGSLFAPSNGQETEITGTYGQLEVEKDAKVTFSGSSKLYAWGFVTGEGEIECKTGAEVFEVFQINDFAGGSNSAAIGLDTSTNAFPFSQYYVQNVECMLRLYSGAKETVVGAVYLPTTSSCVSTALTFIDKQDALFSISSGYVEKYYDFDADKLVCRIVGDAAINYVSVSLAGYGISTKIRQLPISNIGVEIAEGSTVEINQSLQILPDSYVNVEKGAELTVNKNIYFIDSEDWVGGNHVFNASGKRNAALRELQFSATRYDLTGNGKSPRSYTGGDMVDAALDNNGTITLGDYGSLNTTSHGANIYSSDESGVIINESGYEGSSLSVVDFSSSTASVVSEPVELQCADEDAIGLEYSYDKERDKWHTETVTLSFEHNDDSDKVEVKYGEAPDIDDIPKAEKEDYVFSGWRSSLDDVLYQSEDIADNKAYDYVTYTAEWAELPVDPGDPTHSLSLEGQIHVNFYWPLPDGEDPADYTYTFSFMGKTTEPLPLPTTPDENGNGYKTSLAVNAPEMTSDIVATLYKGGVAVKTDTYKAADYAKAYTYTESATELETDTPYLIGKINGSVDWSKASPRYKMVVNTAATGGTEYMIRNVPLTAGDEFKVVIYKGNDTYWWYPNGDNNNYSVSANGVYNIYFREQDYQAEGWFYDHIRVETVSNDINAYKNALLPTLMQATLNYGAKAQAVFGVNTDDYADSTDYLTYKGVFGEVTQDMVNTRLGDSDTRDLNTDMDVFGDYGLEYYGSSLVMDSSTKIKLYYGVKDAELFNANRDNFCVDGQSNYPEKASSDVVCFTIDNVAAANLNHRYKLTNGIAEASYAALDYVTLCMDDKNDNPNLYNLAQALYWYNVYSSAYFVEV